MLNDLRRDRSVATGANPWKWPTRALILTSIALLLTSGSSSPFALASADQGPGDNCATSNVSLSDSQGACSVPLGDPTLTDFFSPWANNVINNQPCYTQVSSSNSYSYNLNTVNEFYAYEFMRADNSASCSTNTGELQDNVGAHALLPGGVYLTAWKSGSATYTVQANFTVYYYQQVGTYCQNGGPTVEGISTMYINNAMYDNSIGRGVGASAKEASSQISDAYCNSSNSESSGPGAVCIVSFISSSIQHGDQLVPRASMWPDVTAEAPWQSGDSAAHAYATMNDTSSAGYSVVLNNIWVT